MLFSRPPPRLAAAPAIASSLALPHSTVKLRLRASSDRSPPLRPRRQQPKRKGKQPSPRPTIAMASSSSSSLAVDKTPPSAPSGQTVRVCPDPASGARELGRLVRRAARRAIAERGSFALVLSGGSLVDALASSLDGDDGDDDGGEAPAASHDGARWHAFWADERLVPGDSPESNAGGARAFLEKAGIPKENVHALADPPPSSPHDAAEEYEARLRALPREVLPVADADEGQKAKMPKFDLVLLGVGPDGHVASLFPGLPAVDLPAGDGRWVVGVEGSPKPPPLRISLSLPAIVSAREVVVVAFGAGKGDVVREALVAEKKNPLLPVQRVEGARWLIDAAAARGLEE